MSSVGKITARPASVLCIIAFALDLPAATLPSGFTETAFTTALSSATAMALAPDGRIFASQQGGDLRVIKNGALLPQPFLTVTVSSLGERGLLGVALDPNFPANNFVYVYYTSTTPTIHNRVSRFTANGDVAVAASEVILLDLDNLSSATNHNGGSLHFGPDGKLYIGVGENANGSNAQTLSNLLGKVLRINADGTIPTDNPFYTQATGRNRAIWALGLRNPYTFAFQNGTGRMFINDVGENTWEEINDGLIGSNYGWPITEGETADPRFVSPLFTYGHGSGPTVGCAITGGAFYNPSTVRFAGYVGKYFFADFCSGWIRTYDPAADTASGFATGAGSVVDLAVGNNGKLYYLNRSSVFEVDAAASGGPVTATLFWQQDGTNVPGVWYMGGTDGSTYLSSKLFSGAQPGWRIVGVGDLNGDGHPDLIWQQDGTNVPGVWYMGGADGSTFLSAKIFSGPPTAGWRIVGVEDLNGDGHPDLIWQQDETNVPGVWYMGGTDGSTYLSSKLLSGAQPGWRIVGPK